MILWHWFFSYFHLILRRSIVVSRGKERENKMIFCLRGSCLSFCKGCLLSFAIWKMQGNLRGKSRSHFLITLINPACSEGERTEETTRFTFLVQDSRSFCKIRLPFARLVFLLPTVEALPSALVVLTLNHKVFWCETCLLCVDVCFV